MVEEKWLPRFAVLLPDSSLTTPWSNVPRQTVGYAGHPCPDGKSAHCYFDQCHQLGHCRYAHEPDTASPELASLARDWIRIHGEYHLDDLAYGAFVAGYKAALCMKPKGAGRD